MADWDITQLGVLEHDTTRGLYSSVIRIDDTHCIVAYQGTDGDGYIKTLSINRTTGAFTEIDVLEHDTTEATYNKLVQISATLYALTYRNISAFGVIATFSIDANADNITAIDLLDYNASDNTWMDMVLVDSTHLIHVTSGSGLDGFIRTFSIDANADNITEVDVLEHDTTFGQVNAIIKIDATHYALAYQGPTGHGYIKTFSIDASADNIAQIALLKFLAATTSDIDIEYNGTSHLIVAYADATSDGFIKTFSFDGSYETLTNVDTLEHDTADGKYNSLVKLSATHYALSYSGTDTHGIIKTFSIDANADNLTELDALEHSNSAQSIWNSSYYDDGIVVLAYSGADDDGFLKSFSIEGSYTPPVTGVSLPTIAEQNIPAGTGWMCWNVTNNVIDALYNSLETLNVIISDRVENEGESLVFEFNSLNSADNKPTLTIDGETITALQATYIKNDKKTTNYSAEDYLRIDAGSTTKTRILLQFSLDGITTVNSASICLYYVAGEVDNKGRPVKLEKVTNPNWVDEEATWENLDDETAWDEEGGDKTDEGTWEGTAEVTLPTRNSWNRFYADRGLRHRCYWRIF